MANFHKWTWKLRENIRCVGGGEIITDIKTCYEPQNPNKFHRIMNVAYLKVMHAIGSSSFFFFFFLGSRFLMSFHRHSFPSIMIICIQPRAVADAGMARHVFFFWATGMVALLGVGALCILRTLRIGSGGTACIYIYIYIYIRKIKKLSRSIFFFSLLYRPAWGLVFFILCYYIILCAIIFPASKTLQYQ